MGELTYGDVLEGYWLERRRELAKETVKGYTVIFKQFGTFVGMDKPFASIMTSHVRAFLNEMEPTCSAKSLANKWIALSGLWSWAEKELGSNHVIRGKIRQPKWRKPAIEPYTQEQVAAMLAACDQSVEWTTRNGNIATSKRATAHRDKAIILALVDTGLRISELCDLLIANYDAKSGRLHVAHGKGDKERFVFAGEATRRAIWRYLAERKESKATAPLFASGTNRSLNRTAIYQMIVRLAARAGVPDATLHKFRHTYAINFLRNGGNVLALQALLGHEQMEMVRTYARLAEVDLASAQRAASPADKWRLG